MIYLRGEPPVEMDDRDTHRITIIETQSEAVVRSVLRQLGEDGRARRVYVETVEHMGDSYTVHQAGAVGSNARSDGNTFSQGAMNFFDGVDLIQLASQLDLVRAAMKKQSEAMPTVEQDGEIGQVASAQIAASNGDRDGVIAHLKQAGKWTVTVAKETSAEIVALTLAHLLGG